MCKWSGRSSNFLPSIYELHGWARMGLQFFKQSTLSVRNICIYWVFFEFEICCFWLFSHMELLRGVRQIKRMQSLSTNYFPSKCLAYLFLESEVIVVDRLNFSEYSEKRIKDASFNKIWLNSFLYLCGNNNNNSNNN